jgi:hypothetical protein
LDALQVGEADLFYHIPALLYSPAYCAENSGALHQDWPRIPLPASKKILAGSAELGRQIATLLNTQSGAKGVTVGEIRSELKIISTVKRVGAGSLTDFELSVDAGWGYVGKGGITMPGKGKVLDRDYSKSEREAISKGAEDLGISSDRAFAIFGAKTLDIYLNDVAFWSNVPEKVWDYTIGGYQVIKKWLSYREEKLLGRPLTKEEVRYVQEMVRRIAAILLLTPALDANYQDVKANTYAWP